MIQTVEAVIDEEGRVQLLGVVQVASPRRALVTVLEEPATVSGEAALLAEGSEVETVIRPSRPQRTPGEGFVRTEGALADDQDWDGIMNEIQHLRHEERQPQGVAE